MIPFQTWLTQIVGYASLLADASRLRRAWMERDDSVTSATDFDELYEQVFDDLDSDDFEQKLGRHLAAEGEESSVLAAFLESLRRVDRCRAACPALQDSATLLESEEWGAVEHAAARVVEVCGSKA